MNKIGGMNMNLINIENEKKMFMEIASKMTKENDNFFNADCNDDSYYTPFDKRKYASSGITDYEFDNPEELKQKLITIYKDHIEMNNLITVIQVSAFKMKKARQNIKINMASSNHDNDDDFGLPIYIYNF